MPNYFLLVKTVTPNNQPFAGASASLDAAACTSTPQTGVLELKLAAGTTGGTVSVSAPVGTAPGAWSDSQAIKVDLTTTPPTMAFSGAQSIYALRLSVTSRGSDFNLEIHFVVDAAFRLAMDGFLANFSLYSVRGVAVDARPQFRMGGPTAYPIDKTRDADLMKVAQAAGIPGYVGVAHSGRPLPDQLRKLTEALITDMLTRSQTTYDLSSPNAIRRMMFDYGIGIDCAGYVQQSFLATRNKSRDALGLKAIDKEDLESLPPASFRKVDIKRARSGDLIILNKQDPSDPNDVGHTVILYSHVVEATDTLLAQRHTDAQGLTENVGTGPAHFYLIDASWGAGPGGNKDGGVQRKGWTYNEASGRWGWLPVGSAVSTFRLDKPYDHPYVGTFRPLTELP